MGIKWRPIKPMGRIPTQEEPNKNTIFYVYPQPTEEEKQAARDRIKAEQQAARKRKYAVDQSKEDYSILNRL